MTYIKRVSIKHKTAHRRREVSQTAPRGKPESANDRLIRTLRESCRLRRSRPGNAGPTDRNHVKVVRGSYFLSTLNRPAPKPAIASSPPAIATFLKNINWLMNALSADMVQ